MGGFWIVTIGNILIAAVWITAMVIFVLSDYPWWASVCVFGAIFSGYSYKTKSKTK